MIYCYKQIKSNKRFSGENLLKIVCVTCGMKNIVEGELKISLSLDNFLVNVVVFFTRVCVWILLRCCIFSSSTTSLKFFLSFSTRSIHFSSVSRRSSRVNERIHFLFIQLSCIGRILKPFKWLILRTRYQTMFFLYLPAGPSLAQLRTFFPFLSVFLPPLRISRWNYDLIAVYPIWSRAIRALLRTHIIK